MKIFHRISGYIKESYNELVYKVSWPTQQELSSSTIVVMSASLILSIVIFVMDYGFELVVKLFYSKIF
jgi:preprotein translocase subunit SecE